MMIKMVKRLRRSFRFGGDYFLWAGCGEDI